MEKTKYLRVFTDGSKNPSHFCVEDIHGNYIVIDNTDECPKSDFPYSIPEEFTSFTYVEEAKARKEIFQYLDCSVVEFLGTEISPEGLSETKELVSKALKSLRSYLDCNWKILEIKSTTVFLHTKLFYICRSKM